MCLDSADVVRDEPIILKNKIEEQLIVGAFCVDSRDAGLYKSLGILRAARTKAHSLRVDGGTRATDIGRIDSAPMTTARRRSLRHFTFLRPAAPGHTSNRSHGRHPRRSNRSSTMLGWRIESCE